MKKRTKSIAICVSDKHVDVVKDFLSSHSDAAGELTKECFKYGRKCGMKMMFLSMLVGGVSLVAWSKILDK